MQQYCSKRVRTQVTLFGSLLDKYFWEKYDHPYPSNYGLKIVSLLFFYKNGFNIK